jgi:hypothetical protein
MSHETDYQDWMKAEAIWEDRNKQTPKTETEQPTRRSINVAGAKKKSKRI